LGLQPAEFWDLTWSEFQRAARGYHRRQESEWQRTRWMTTQLINIQLKREDRITPAELLWLPSDPVEEVSDEETEDLFAAIRRRDAGLTDPAVHE
jgi:hypothetical protein